MAEETKGPVTPPPASGGTGGSDKDVEDNRVLAAVSYLWIVSVIALLVKKDSKFVVFHAKQGLILFIVSIILSFIPILGWLLNIIVLVFVIMGVVKALDRQWYKVPLVGQLADKIKI